MPGRCGDKKQLDRMLKCSLAHATTFLVVLVSTCLLQDASTSPVKWAEVNSHGEETYETADGSFQTEVNLPEMPDTTRINTQAVTLSQRGRQIKRILLFSLVGGVCSSDDWRGDLPRHIMSLLPGATAVDVRVSHDARVPWRCSECTVSGLRSWQQGYFEDCRDYLDSSEGLAQPADLMIMIGSGKLNTTLAPLDPAKWINMRDALESDYVGPSTLKVHLPIRKFGPHPDLFSLDVIIQDNDFAKPLSSEAFSALVNTCKRHSRDPDLLYVGRYKPGKGQLKFLRHVDPAELEGFHVHFYSSADAEDGYGKELVRVAAERGIAATVHGPVAKPVLLEHYCRAAGQIHYANDNNPRVVYEALSADNPVFVTPESNLPDIVYQQAGFVSSVSINSTKNDFAVAFHEFMEHVRNPEEVRPAVRSFVHEFLDPQRVYEGVARKMGLII